MNKLNKHIFPVGLYLLMTIIIFIIRTLPKDFIKKNLWSFYHFTYYSISDLFIFFIFGLIIYLI